MSGDLQGKVFLVTGATEGIGKAATREFAKRGAELVLVARNKEKGERFVAELRRATGDNDISLIVADMAATVQGRPFQHRRLHISRHIWSGSIRKRLLSFIEL